MVLLLEQQTEKVLTKGESLLFVGKLALGFFGILALLYILTVFMPRIAKWVDKKRGKQSERISYDHPEDYKVQGLFDPDRTGQNKPDENHTSENEEKENGKGEKAG